MANSYDDYLGALRMRESSGNYSLVNTLGFLGAYQFGEAALIDLGFVNNDGSPYDNDFGGGFTGKLGIGSVAEFLETPAAQDAAADAWFPLVWNYATDLGLDSYLGQTVGGVLITASSIISGAHLLGAGAVQTWLESGGSSDLADAYGTPIAEYLALFSGYEIPFVAQEDLGTPTPPPPPPPAGLVLAGDSGDNTLSGAEADDQLDGLTGNDSLDGNDGDDALNGGPGSDALIGGAGDDVIKGGAGPDLIFSGAGDDTLSGGGNSDFLFGMTGLNRMSGNAGNDLLIGIAGENRMSGNAGNDLLVAVGGRNEMSGDAGNDLLVGGAGTDLFVFADNDDDDRVLGFDPSPTGDVIVLADVGAITGYADLARDHMVQQGDDVVIDDHAGTTITLMQMTLDQLESGDFLF